MRTIIISAFMLSIAGYSFGQEKTTSDDKTETLNCQVVTKPFINKIGKTTEHKELYLRCSIQDYFIKLCESDVAEDEIRAFIDKGISVEAEIVEGNWDICPDDPDHTQSRTGKYVVIKKINE